MLPLRRLGVTRDFKSVGRFYTGGEYRFHSFGLNTVLYWKNGTRRIPYYNNILICALIIAAIIIINKKYYEDFIKYAYVRVK